MPRYLYYTDTEGKIQRTLIEKKPHKGTPDCMKMSFDEMVLDGYRQAEAEGQPWRGPLSKSQTKRVHERALAMKE